MAPLQKHTFEVKKIFIDKNESVMSFNIIKNMICNYYIVTKQENELTVKVIEGSLECKRGIVEEY